MRRLALGLTAISFGVFGLVQTMACNGDFDICVGDQCGVTEGGPSDATDEQQVPPNCDLSKDPKDSAACVDDTIALFVSPAGSDANSGTKTAPLKTINAAIGKTDSQHTRIYLCAGAYNENVKVATGTKTAGIYAGFSCSDWSYAGGAPNAIVTSSNGYALEVNNLNTTLTVEDVEFDSPDAQTPGASSIAVFITQSTGVILKRVNAKAGKGADGADAVATSNYDAGTASTGNDATSDMGAPSCLQSCGDGQTSTGGGGGTGSTDPALPSSGLDGGPSIPAAPAGSDGIGGSAKSSGCNTGDTGAHGIDADAGTAGASAGMLGASGWVSVSGQIGGTAGPGQGGGGGSGGKHTGVTNNGGGGSGGCGGCGGGGGAGGGSGASSFGVLVFQSVLTLDSCQVSASAAGNGKQGGNGQGGQTGGSYGNQVAGGPGCQGGAGGNGGNGAGGGGGAAGNSIALGYLGTQPTATNTTFNKGSAGTPGGGGTGAAGNNGLAGADGISAEQQDLKP